MSNEAWECLKSCITFCTLLYNAVTDVKIAQEILGHNSVNVTLEIYTHLNNENKRLSADKLNQYLQSVKC